VASTIDFTKAIPFEKEYERKKKKAIEAKEQAELEWAIAQENGLNQDSCWEDWL